MPTQVYMYHNVMNIFHAKSIVTHKLSAV